MLSVYEPSSFYSSLSVHFPTKTLAIYFLLHILLLSSAKPLSNIFPVDDRENVFDIVGSDVLILKVVGMFPNIDSQ